MVLSTSLLRLVYCAIAFSIIITCCSSNVTRRALSCKDKEYGLRNDDGFFGRYKPQSTKGQYVADKCIAKRNCSAAESAKYREYDGTCNNLQFSMWGVTNAALVRLLPANYSDGKSKHRKAVDGSELPNARLVRTTVLKSKIIKDKAVSYLFSVFAQYISHDTADTNFAATNFSTCCDGDKWPGQLPTNCTSTQIPEDDEFYKKFNVTCVPRLRALTTDDYGCPLKPNQHVISLTHFIDQSLIYGKNKEDSTKFKGKNGLLQVQEINNKIFPKANANPRQACDIRKDDKPICMDAGDPRLNQNPPFLTLVTIFVRFHNDFAKKLLKINPNMSESDVFEETRRVMIAVEHFIVRKEFLPLLIGPEFMTQAQLNYTNTDYDDNYDVSLNPATLNEFMNAAYRALHSTILNYLRLQINGTSQNLVINDWINRPVYAVDKLDPILKSISTEPMAKQDIFGSSDMNNLVFRRSRMFGTDLETTSIERDREAGFAGFCDYMETLLGEPKINSWDDLKQYFTQETINNLKKVYKNFRDIDMYVGGVAERPIGNSMFGKLFTSIIADQFKRWLIGDRHSPTLRNGPGKFTKAQLKELNKISMSYLLCKYGDNLDQVPSRPFEINRGDLSNPSFEENKKLTPEERLESSSGATELNSEERLESECSHNSVENEVEDEDDARSKQVECKNLADIDLTPWKF